MLRLVSDLSRGTYDLTSRSPLKSRNFERYLTRCQAEVSDFLNSHILIPNTPLTPMCIKHEQISPTASTSLQLYPLTAQSSICLYSSLSTSLSFFFFLSIFNFSSLYNIHLFCSLSLPICFLYSAFFT